MLNLKEIISHKFINNSFISVVGMVISGVLGYLFHFSVSRKLPVSQYGELQSLISILSILGLFSAAISNIVLKYSSIFAGQNDKESNYQFFKYILKKTSIYTFFLIVAFFICSPFIQKRMEFSSIIGLFFVGFSVFIGLICTIYQNVLAGWEKFLYVHITGAAGAGFKLLIGIIITIFYPSAAWVISSFAFSGIIAFFFYRMYVNKLYPEKKNTVVSFENLNFKYFTPDYLKKSLLPIFGFSALIVLLNSIDVLLMKYFTSSELTGYFGAYNMLGKMIFWVNGAIIAVIMPVAISESHSKGNLNLKILIGTYGFLLLTGLVASVLYFLIPEFTIKMLFGSKYTIYSGNLWLFGIIGTLFSLLMLESNLAFARHDFNITYLLILVVFLEMIGIYFFHQNLFQVGISLISSLGIGFLGSLLVNFIHRKKNIDKDLLESVSVENMNYEGIDVK
ncbi:MAG: hypothetical protein H7A23_26670 [Leptospiraceae bacterium]|nr:hypothetical protein [Leptospiraceae bacterium]MCP5498157.1 hypothetical protein [Leptospiraceae bacterium]